MIRHRSATALVLVALCASCAPSSSSTEVTAFTGATVWDGTRSAPIPDATIVVRDGRIESVEAGGTAPSGAEVVALDGLFVIPGLVDAHAHASGLWADAGVEDEADRVRGDLDLFARYGVTTVNSLGDGEAAIAVRDARQAMSDSAGPPSTARLLVAGEVIAASEPAEARAAALARADAGVDWLKLRVDDNLGTSEKMPWEAVQAVMEVGEERGIPVATHLFYLDDAKRLLEMGSAMVAHSVRDTDVDDEFVTQLAESGACYVPTLTRELSTFTYATRPDFFDDAFFTRDANAAEVERLSDPDFQARMADSPTAAGYREALDQAMRNLAVLSESGARIAMGTDAGPAARFPGYFEHLEMWMMAEAGMSPEEILLSATSSAADCAGAAGVGTLIPGSRADFLVLGDDPLQDIRATRSLERVYIGGVSHAR